MLIKSQEGQSTWMTMDHFARVEVAGENPLVVVDCREAGEVCPEVPCPAHSWVYSAFFLYQ